MKDFDTARAERVARERTFKIGGHEFVYRPSVPPEALLPWDRRGDAEGQDFLDIIDLTITAFLEPGQEDQWKTVRSTAAENPLNIGDMIELITWLFEEQAGRPTGPSSASSATPAPNGTPLTAVSSLPATPPASVPSTSASSAT